MGRPKKKKSGVRKFGSGQDFLPIIRGIFADPTYKPLLENQLCTKLHARGGDKEGIRQALLTLRREEAITKDHHGRLIPTGKKLSSKFSKSNKPTSKRERDREIELPSHLVGVLRADHNGKPYLSPIGKEMFPGVSLMESDRLLPPRSSNALVAVAKLDMGRSQPGRLQGRLTEILGPLSDVKIDSKIVIVRKDLPREFPAAVLEEAEKAPPTISKQEIEKRKDLRKLPFVTIDGADAKDHDDAVALDSEGNLWVAIADVAHYVAPQSQLDREAAGRGNSYYFPDLVLPMLPERLSNGLCSLRPNEDRLALVAKLTLDFNGRLSRTDLMEAVICSRARLTYEGVDLYFTKGESGTIPTDLLSMLKQMKLLAEKTYKARMEDGGVDFDLSETKIVLNAEGVVTAMARRERTAAPRLIEEFMLLANKGVAIKLNEAASPGVFRIHAPPEPIRLQDFYTLLKAHGVKTPQSNNLNDPKEITRMLAPFFGTPRGKVFSYLALRTMSQAAYSPDNVGHFGLGFPDYVHFTSPIRRYADLIIHRLVKHLLHQTSFEDPDLFPTTYGTLENLCLHISAQERVAQLAEREVRTLKAIRFLSDKVGQTFRGVIVGALKPGLFVELDEHALEGFIHISRLPNDRYEFFERDLSIRGRNRGKTFRVGDSITIRLESAELETFRVEFTPA